LIRRFSSPSIDRHSAFPSPSIGRFSSSTMKLHSAATLLFSDVPSNVAWPVGRDTSMYIVLEEMKDGKASEYTSKIIDDQGVHWCADRFEDIKRLHAVEMSLFGQAYGCQSFDEVSCFFPFCFRASCAVVVFGWSGGTHAMPKEQGLAQDQTASVAFASPGMASDDHGSLGLGFGVRDRFLSAPIGGNPSQNFFFDLGGRFDLCACGG
jgi:hypothetical protein